MSSFSPHLSHHQHKDHQIKPENNHSINENVQVRSHKFQCGDKGNLYLKKKNIRFFLFIEATQTSKLCGNDLDLRGNDSEGKEEANQGQVDCQPGSICQLQGAGFRVRSTVANAPINPLTHLFTSTIDERGILPIYIAH